MWARDGTEQSEEEIKKLCVRSRPNGGLRLLKIYSSLFPTNFVGSKNIRALQKESVPGLGRVLCVSSANSLPKTLSPKTSWSSSAHVGQVTGVASIAEASAQHAISTQYVNLRGR